tara:strand:+ start:87 stop:584 length:498 start_codon:yes stop_codon:yes gene_type:complete
MATITTLGASDSGSTSRTTINDNFTNLNTDKGDIDTDVTLAANSDTLVPSQKAIKTYVDNASLTIETTTGVTHSLTTTAGQTVCVWAKGHLARGMIGGTVYTVKLNYNSVEKDTTSMGGDNDGLTTTVPFALMYTEVPGAGTQDITVTAASGTLADVVIIVQIIG